MFSADIEANRDALSKKIAGKSVLVIGGAGSIGSSFIKALLPFKPASLVVVDYNENALAELTRDLRSTKGMYVPEDYIPYPTKRFPNFLVTFCLLSHMPIHQPFGLHSIYMA